MYAFIVILSKQTWSTVGVGPEDNKLCYLRRQPPDMLMTHMNRGQVFLFCFFYQLAKFHPNFMLQLYKRPSEWLRGKHDGKKKIKVTRAGKRNSAGTGVGAPRRFKCPLESQWCTRSAFLLLNKVDTSGSPFTSKIHTGESPQGPHTRETFTHTHTHTHTGETTRGQFLTA